MWKSILPVPIVAIVGNGLFLLLHILGVEMFNTI